MIYISFDMIKCQAGMSYCAYGLIILLGVMGGQACHPRSLQEGTDYFVHPQLGQDTHDGKSKAYAFRTLARASQIDFQPGDRLLLAAGYTHYGMLQLTGLWGSTDAIIEIRGIAWEKGKKAPPARIDCSGYPNAVLLDGASFVRIAHLRITGGAAQFDSIPNYNMRCGILITNSTEKNMTNLLLDSLHIHDVFFEPVGFVRGEGEVKTANGTQRYGWGIRLINSSPATTISNVRITNNTISNVAHTGIKLTGSDKNIHHIVIAENKLHGTGGPGIQMSQVEQVHVHDNVVSHSGSHDDSRKWGRGSGLWTWGSSKVLIERNSFLHANGPADSAGAHIDFNCDNIILQYNFSAYNAGGFCEVLGNTYNCAYRYNLSVNDGFRVKGVDGAFQEGKTLWLSGYQGQSKERKGPVNFYFYNNTIVCTDTLIAKIAIDKTSRGLLIANNIFYLQGGAQMVIGDQYKPDSPVEQPIEPLVFHNNVFLNENSWPTDIGLMDTAPTFGNPNFIKLGGLNLADYCPANRPLVKCRAKPIELLAGDKAGLWQPLVLERDLMGVPLPHRPSIGAIEPQKCQL